MVAKPQHQHEDTYERGPDEVTPEEGHRIFDDVARRYMGISGEEFLRRWNAGAIEDDDAPGVRDVVPYLPLAR